jgi:hypothetical protein
MGREMHQIFWLSESRIAYQPTVASTNLSNSSERNGSIITLMAPRLGRCGDLRIDCAGDQNRQRGKSTTFNLQQNIGAAQPRHNGLAIV